MIKSFRITNSLGESIVLKLRSPEESGLLVHSVTGLDPSKANINTSEISSRDGSLFNSARVSQRNIVFGFIFTDSLAGESIEEVRHKLYRYFKVKGRVTIIVETDFRLLRTSGYVESVEASIFSSQEGAQVSIICPDPYFYSTGVGGTMVTTFNGVWPLFSFPYSNESSERMTEFGIIRSHNENVIVYHGDAEIGVTIKIRVLGPAKHILITNTVTKERMRLDTDKIASIVGSPIKLGDDIVVTTMRGHKTVTIIRDGVSFNILNCLGKQADWFQLMSGDNVFLFSAEEGTVNLSFMIENQVIYGGV